MFDIARKFASNVIPEVIRPLRVLWNEVIAFIFFVLFVVAAATAWRSYQTSDGSSEGIGRAVIAGFFGVVMLIYGVQSYTRSRKVGKTGRKT